MAQINLRNLYAVTFGFVGLPYTALDTRTAATTADPYEPAIVGGTQPERTGLLGTPIHLPCELGGLLLPNEPMIDIAGEKLIVKTPIDGNDGTFKELYSTGDMQVTIRGICVDDNDPDSYPEDQVRRLRNVIEQKQHVRVVNRLTSLWNIEYLAIESYSFPAVPGELGMQGYELRCTSDREFQLNLRAR
jgi:hypothetical protein